MSYKIIRIKDGSLVQGPFSKSKCRRLLTTLEGNADDFKIVKDGAVLRDPNAPPKAKKSRRQTKEMDMNPPPGPEIKSDPDFANYKYQSGMFTTSEAVEATMEDLQVTDYVIKKDKHQGFFSLYNEPEE